MIKYDRISSFLKIILENWTIDINYIVKLIWQFIVMSNNFYNFKSRLEATLPFFKLWSVTLSKYANLF